MAGLKPCQNRQLPCWTTGLPSKPASSCSEIVIATCASALIIILAQLPALHQEENGGPGSDSNMPKAAQCSRNTGASMTGLP